MKLVAATVRVGLTLVLVSPLTSLSQELEREARMESAGAQLDSGGTGLEQVIVTARRRAERQQDVPIAITTLGEEFLKQNAVNNLTDLNGKVPALNIESYNSASYTNIGIRANRSANVAPGQDSAVGYYFNEVNYGFPVGINQQMFDLQSVEILKGPQGTLFGRNTTGGAVLLTTARPTQQFEGSASVDLTTFDGRYGVASTAVLNLPASDALQFRMGAQIIRRDGYVDNLISDGLRESYEVVPFRGISSGKEMNNDKSEAWRIGALWTPATNLENYLSYQGSRLRSRGLAYTLTALNPNGAANFATGGAADVAFNRRRAQQRHDFWTTEQGANTYNRLDAHAVMNTTVWNITESLTLKNVMGWRKFDLEDLIGISGLPFQILDSTINDYGRERSEELQLQGEFAGTGSWVLGAYYSDQRISHPNSTIALPQFGLVPDDKHAIAENDSRAIFAQATVPLPGIENLSFTGGVRRTQDDRKMFASRFRSTERTACGLTDANGVPLPADACFFRGKVDYSRTTYNLSLEYKPDAATLLYLARRKGYRAGGFDYLPVDPQTFEPFDPEDVTDYELGVKRDWRFGDVSLRTNLAIYKQDYEGIQRFSNPVTSPSAFFVINAADAKIDGGELEVTLIPREGLELSAYYARIEADFENFVTGAGDFSDNEFAQVPKNQYNLRARYELPLPPNLGLVSMQADYNWRSHVFFVDTAEGPLHGPAESQGQDSYGLLNLRVDWREFLRSNLDLAVYVRNATAEEYHGFGIQLYQNLGYNIATIGEPRIFGLQGVYRF